MQNTIVLATRNAGKVRELAHALEVYGLTVLGLESFESFEDVEETGLTFEENALLKAHYVAKKTGHVAIADDSGLEVDALDARPGVYSARYSDDWQSLENESKDARNMRKLLHEMQDVPEAKRTARFVCAMAACTPQGEHMVVRGTWEGSILTCAQGSNGFGYDPVFYDASLDCSAAQLSKEEKNARSHRGNALRLLMEAWADFHKSARV